MNKVEPKLSVLEARAKWQSASALEQQARWELEQAEIAHKKQEEIELLAKEQRQRLLDTALGATVSALAGALFGFLLRRKD